MPQFVVLVRLVVDWRSLRLPVRLTLLLQTFHEGQKMTSNGHIRHSSFPPPLLPPAVFYSLSVAGKITTSGKTCCSEKVSTNPKNPLSLASEVQISRPQVPTICFRRLYTTRGRLAPWKASSKRASQGASRHEKWW